MSTKDHEVEPSHETIDDSVESSDEYDLQDTIVDLPAYDPDSAHWPDLDDLDATIEQPLVRPKKEKD